MLFYISLLVAGFFGGVVRGLVGFIKHQLSYKNVGFDLKYFFGMSFLSGIVGLMTSMALNEVGLTLNNSFSSALSFILGYAGGDFLESVYKIILDKAKIAGAKK